MAPPTSNGLKLLARQFLILLCDSKCHAKWHLQPALLKVAGCQRRMPLDGSGARPGSCDLHRWRLNIRKWKSHLGHVRLVATALTSMGRHTIWTPAARLRVERRQAATGQAVMAATELRSPARSRYVVGVGGAASPAAAAARPRGQSRGR
jgi:hypothetical protein